MNEYREFPEKEGGVAAATRSDKEEEAHWGVSMLDGGRRRLKKWGPACGGQEGHSRGVLVAASPRPVPRATSPHLIINSECGENGFKEIRCKSVAARGTGHPQGGREAGAAGGIPP